jgi:hypothetical protein
LLLEVFGLGVNVDVKERAGSTTNLLQFATIF